jgi:putative transposase
MASVACTACRNGRLSRCRPRRAGRPVPCVLSLTARGMTSREIVAHLEEVYGMKTSKETISTITDKALDSMNEWRTRPLDPVYPVIFVDAIHV